MKKRLLKDLPFENVKAGSVIFKGSHGHGDAYCINQGEAYYQGGGSSSNGCSSFNETESSILDVIWDNAEWFEEAQLKHISIVANRDSIVLKFKSLDMNDAQELARGIQHWITIVQSETSQYTWDRFKGFTTDLK